MQEGGDTEAGAHYTGTDSIANLQIADALPPDSERKLEVAQGIISAAFRQKSAEMGGELQRLRMAAADKDSRIRSLEGRLAECQDALRDARSQVLRLTQLCMHGSAESFRLAHAW